MKIGNNEKNLIISSAEDLIKKLNEDKISLEIKQMAFGWLLDDNEEIQVQVVVTREEDNFLDPFCDEHTCR
jgi:hypothetical protein